jgi:hypothetical protein
MDPLVVDDDEVVPRRGLRERANSVRSIPMAKLNAQAHLLEASALEK